MTRFTLDTNVLVYSVDATSPSKQRKARDLIWRSRLADCVLSVQAISEFYWVATRKGTMPKEEAASQVEDWCTLFEVAAPRASTCLVAMRASREHKIAYWDALLWSTARDAGCELVLTEDFQDGRLLEGVLFRNPFVDELPVEVAAALVGEPPQTPR